MSVPAYVARIETNPADSLTDRPGDTAHMTTQRRRLRKLWQFDRYMLPTSAAILADRVAYWGRDGERNLRANSPLGYRTAGIALEKLGLLAYVYSVDRCEAQQDDSGGGLG